MIIGKVIGSVVSTRKCSTLNGHKLMVVKPFDECGCTEKKIIAVDYIGAGIGEIVLVSLGSAARVGQEKSHEAPLDAAIVGIVDEGIGLAGANLDK